MMTSTIWLSCVTPAPNRPGAMRRISIRISGVRRGIRMRTPIPARRTAQSSMASITTPATLMPQAKACAGRRRHTASATA